MSGENDQNQQESAFTKMIREKAEHLKQLQIDKERLKAAAAVQDESGVLNTERTLSAHMSFTELSSAFNITDDKLSEAQQAALTQVLVKKLEQSKSQTNIMATKRFLAELPIIREQREAIYKEIADKINPPEPIEPTSTTSPKPPRRQAPPPPSSATSPRAVASTAPTPASKPKPPVPTPRPTRTLASTAALTPTVLEPTAPEVSRPISTASTASVVAGANHVMPSKEQMDELVKEFNRKPEDIFSAMEAANVKDHENVLLEIMKHREVFKEKVGEFLSEWRMNNPKDEIEIEKLPLQDRKRADLLCRFIEENVNFKGSFTDALRSFLTLEKFQLPGESQKVDRIVAAFVRVYVNRKEKLDFLPTTLTQKEIEDSIHILTFQTIMLNTDLHNDSVKNKISKDAFLKMGKGYVFSDKQTKQFYSGAEKFLGDVYESVKKNEIQRISDTSEKSTPKESTPKGSKSIIGSIGNTVSKILPSFSFKKSAAPAKPVGPIAEPTSSRASDASSTASSASPARRDSTASTHAGSTHSTKTDDLFNSLLPQNAQAADVMKENMSTENIQALEKKVKPPVPTPRRPSGS